MDVLFINNNGSRISNKVRQEYPMQLAIKLYPKPGKSLQTQIFESIREQILNGRLNSGALLPSSRLLSEQLGVSRNTVLMAYERLIAEDYVYSVKTLGTFVNASLPENSLTLSDPGRACIKAEERHPQRFPVTFKGRVQALNNPRRDQLDIDFWVGRPDPMSFPINRWRSIIIEKLRDAGRNMTEYHNPAGIHELRQAIVEHLKPARGINADPGQVIIVNGSQEALNIVSRLLINHGTPVVTESPCYQGAVYVLESYGADITPVRVDSHGLQVSDLKGNRARLVYVTPSHQYPMGVTLSLERRIRLLDWARESGAYILEDDYDSDFRHNGSPLTALAGQDPHGCVIYMGTFSKSLGAGLRLGYMVLPAELVEPARRVKALIDNGHAWLDQAVMAEFISSNAYSKHLRKIRKSYLGRRDCLVDALTRHFGEVELSGLNGGMHLVWQLPHYLPDAAIVKEQSEQAGVGVYTLETGAAYIFDQKNSSKRLLMLGYSSIPESRIREGIDRIANAVVCN